MAERKRDLVPVKSGRNRSVSVGISHPITFGMPQKEPMPDPVLNADGSNTNAATAKKRELKKYLDTKERIVKDVQAPARDKLTVEQLFKDDKIDTDLLKDHLRREGINLLDLVRKLIFLKPTFFKLQRHHYNSVVSVSSELITCYFCLIYQ